MALTIWTTHPKFSGHAKARSTSSLVREATKADADEKGPQLDSGLDLGFHSTNMALAVPSKPVEAPSSEGSYAGEFTDPDLGDPPRPNHDTFRLVCIKLEVMLSRLL